MEMEADLADPVASVGDAESAAPRRSDQRSAGGRDSSWIGEASSASTSIFGLERESLYGELSYVVYNSMK